MNPDRSIIKNTIATYGQVGMSMVFGFAFTVFAARYLGTAGYGEYILAFSYLVIFQTLSQFGLSELLVRNIARNKQDVSKYITSALVLTFPLSILGLALMALEVKLSAYSHETSLTILIIGSSLIPLSVAFVFNSVFNAFERMEYIAYIGIIGSMAKLGLGVLVLSKGYGVVGLAVMILFINLLTSILGLFLLVRYIAMPRLELDMGFTRSLIRSALIFFAITICTVIAQRVNVIMLSKLGGTAQVGLYGAADKISSVLMVGAYSLNIAIYPVLSKFFMSSRESFNRVYENTLKYELIIIAPIVMVGILLADNIILLVYGEEFAAAAAVLRVLWLVAIPFFATWTFSRVILASDNQRVTLRVASVNLVSNLIFIYILIPRYGAVGAALALLMTFSVAAAQNYAFVSSRVYRLNLLSIVGKPLLSAALAGAVAFLLLKRVSYVMAVPASLGMYLLGSVILKTVTKDEVRMLLGLFTRSRA